MKLKNELFAGERINTCRQPELDIAKALITFFLAFIHTIIECTSDEGLCSGIPYVFDTIIGGPLAAPMFMFTMGTGVVYTQKRTPADIAKKGLLIELIALILNISRYTVPYLIGYAITGNYEKFIGMIWYRTFCCDMLEFAGFALLLIALFKHFKISDRIIFLVACGMSVAANFFNGVDMKNPVLNIVFGHIIGTEDAAGKVFSDFPLLNWFIVPVIGYLFGTSLIRVKDKRKFYLLLSPVCLAATIIYFATGIINGRGMFGEGQNCYYHISTPDVISAITAAVGLFGVYYAISKYIPERLNKLVFLMSKGVTVVYVVQWVLVVYSTNIILYAIRGTQELPVIWSLVLSFAISFVSVACAKIYFDIKQKRKKHNEQASEKHV